MADYSEIDLAIALQLQAQFEEERRVHHINNENLTNAKTDFTKWSEKELEAKEQEQEKLSVSLIDPTWELLDPNPNIHDLFLIFNDQFFWGRLSGIEVSWSPRMTLCAGVCSYQSRAGHCSVRLSLPLLKLRPRKDLVETLLHELIHAYLFITKNNTDHDGHGPQFHKHMNRINKIAGTKISVYHTFHDEVNLYKNHVWKCNGPCKNKPPYFGLVKRSMNRAPSERDPWWNQHRMTCGGTYEKIKQPEGYGVKKKNKKITEDSKSKTSTDIRQFFNPSNGSNPQNPTKNNIKTLNNSTAGSPKIIQNNSNVHSIDTSSNVNKGNARPKSTSRATDKDNNSSASTNKNKRLKGIGVPITGMKNGSVGSNTLVVGKNFKSKAEVPQTVIETNFTPFVGQGHSLGSHKPGTGKSRLLLLQNKTKDETTSKTTEHSGNLISKNETSSDSEQSTSNLFKEKDYITCPLCSKQFVEIDFDNHIAECLGDIDSEDNGNDSCQNFDSSSSDSISILEDEVTASNTDIDLTVEEKDVFNSSDVVTLGGDNSVMIVDDNCDSSPTSIDKIFPCPICNVKFFESEINTHVNKHFS